MNNRKVGIGIVQMACATNREIHLQNTIEKIKEAAEKGAQVIVLQELFQTPYFCDVEDYENFKLAEAVPGPTTEHLGNLAKSLGVVIVASLFEKRAQGLYHNTTAVLDADGTYLGKYRKMHIPDDPGYYEKFYFTPGDLGYKVFQTRFGRIGVLICWDQWYPEAARITALMGADFLVYPTAIGWALHQDEETNADQYHAWQSVMKGHSVANGIPVVAVNRTGVEGEMQFWGGSFVTNAFGKVMFQAPHLDASLTVQQIDLTEADYYRTHWPFLRDRRIDAYEPILNRFID